VNARDIDRALGIDRALRGSAWGCSLVIPQHFDVRFEIRRTIVGHDAAPQVYIDACHARLHWARFCLLWAAIGGQMCVDEEEWSI